MSASVLSAANPIPPLAGRNRMVYGAIVVATVLLFVLQMALPSLAHAAKGEWIEICSEYGISMVQIEVDETGTPQENPCPECEDCVCSAAADVSPFLNSAMGAAHWVALGAGAKAAPFDILSPNRKIRPETRGPPTAPNSITARAPRVFKASFPSKGGAL
ncbi:hypothetical protein Q4578_02150 [Shimia thalassica]|uniref:hypothetical protein n=1 Tax=Shimia thalassica TaxID=1715693 RepID=UPI0026E3EE36|nr:hypothetical protein [Shimia thalassica]MDO6520366.1 hypothetical protein [Shimia thalassica]